MRALRVIFKRIRIRVKYVGECIRDVIYEVEQVWGHLLHDARRQTDARAQLGDQLRHRRTSSVMAMTATMLLQKLEMTGVYRMY